MIEEYQDQELIDRAKLNFNLILNEKNLLSNDFVFDNNNFYFLIFFNYFYSVNQENFVKDFLMNNEFGGECVFKNEDFTKMKNHIWTVDTSISNKTAEDRINKKEDLSFYYKFADFEVNQNDLSNLTYNQTNTLVLNSKFNFKSFPFDRQILKIVFENNYPYPLFEDIDDIIFNPAEVSTNIENSTLYEWDFINFSKKYYGDLLYDDDDFLNSENYRYDETDMPGGFLEIDVQIERNSSYYLFKVLSPIFLILIVCWSVIFIKPSQLESRLTVSIVCFLTLIAFNFVIDENLPKLGYLTLIDYFILWSYIFSALPTLISIIEYKISDNEILSKKINNLIKFIGIPSYLVIIYILFNINSSNNINNINNLLKAVTL